MGVNKGGKMKKIICSIVVLFITIFITNQIAQAENITSEELLTRFKTHRNAVYQKIDLTEKQENQINAIDKKVYAKLEPELKQISLYIKRIDEIANSDNCTIERIDEVKEEFKTTEKRISVIKNKQEKAINRVLTKEQKAAYEEAKEVQRKEIQKEVEALKEAQLK